MYTSIRMALGLCFLGLCVGVLRKYGEAMPAEKRDKIEVNVLYSEKFTSWQLEVAKLYQFDVSFIDSPQINNLLGEKLWPDNEHFNEKKQYDHDTVYCLIRAWIANDHIDEFISSYCEINFKEGLSCLSNIPNVSFRIHYYDDIKYKIVKLQIDDQERNEIMNKRAVKLYVTRLRIK